MDLDKRCHDLEIELKKLQKQLRAAVDNRDFVEAAKLQAKQKTLEPDFEAVKDELLTFRKSNVEDIIVIDMKQDWKPEGALEDLDLSHKFQKQDGSFSVQLAIDNTKNGTESTPKVFYALSSRTNTYHKLEVKYRDAHEDFPNELEPAPSTSKRQALQNDIDRLAKEIKEAVARRDFVSAGAKQKEQAELKERLENLPSGEDSSGQRRELEADIIRLQDEIKEAVQKKNFVQAGQKQQELTQKQAQLDSLPQSDSDGEPEDSLLEQKTTLEETIQQLTVEVKDAVSKRDFVRAGSLQKDMKTKEAELQVIIDKINNSHNGGGENQQIKEEMKKCEEEIAQLGAEIKEAVTKRDFVTAGSKQKDVKELQVQLEELKAQLNSGGGGDTSAFDSEQEQKKQEAINSLENEIAELTSEIQEAVAKRDFVAAGSKQQAVKDKQAQLEALKNGAIEGELMPSKDNQQQIELVQKLEGEVAQLEAEMKDFVAQRKFVEAGTKQRELNAKKEELEREKNKL